MYTAGFSAHWKLPFLYLYFLWLPCTIILWTAERSRTRLVCRYLPNSWWIAYYRECSSMDVDEEVRNAISWWLMCMNLLINSHYCQPKSRILWLQVIHFPIHSAHPASTFFLFLHCLDNPASTFPLLPISLRRQHVFISSSNQNLCFRSPALRLSDDPVLQDRIDSDESSTDVRRAAISWNTRLSMLCAGVGSWLLSLFLKSRKFSSAISQTLPLPFSTRFCHGRAIDSIRWSLF